MEGEEYDCIYSFLETGTYHSGTKAIQITNGAKFMKTMHVPLHPILIHPIVFGIKYVVIYSLSF